MPLRASAYADIDKLLEVATELKNDIIELTDSALAQSPQRRDVIQMYMDIGHTHMMAVFSRYWEKEAINLIAFDLLTLIEWCYEYLINLKRFGVVDVYLKNGFTNLCDAYTRKIHSSIYRMVTNVII